VSAVVEPVEVSGLAVDRGAARIVADLDLVVRPGEVVGVLGPNGSGKSTLLKAVYRVLRPSAGAVRLGDDDVAALKPRAVARRMAVVAQEGGVDFDFTVTEVVAMGRTPHHGSLDRDTPEDAAVVAAALARVGMSALAGRAFPTLSGGEKQRVLVARALAQQAGVLVLDEPTNHLDIRFQLELLDLVAGLGVTTLAALHDLNLAARSCHRLYVLASGRVVAAGTPAEVLTPEVVRDVFGVDAVTVPHPVTGAPQLVFLGPSRPDPTDPAVPTDPTPPAPAGRTLP
jgi:iron complex transport system ATP-binding protein